MLNDLENVVASLVLPPHSKETLAPRLKDSVSLWLAGEPAVALENLCDNLYEFEIALDQDTHDKLVDLCRHFLVSAKRVALLMTLLSPINR